MYELPKGQTTEAEQAVLRKLRVWIAALAVACLIAGVSIGAMLSGNPVVAQNDAAQQQASQQQLARAPEALSATFVEIARRVGPAVVNIDTVTEPESARRGARPGDDEDDETETLPLPEMFRRGRRPARGVGSGFLVDPRGFILTNQHVVEGATRIMVRLSSGELLRGQVIGMDEETDLAVVKVEAGRELPSLRMGDSNQAQVGDWVLAIGSPFNLEQTVTAGIISTKERRTPGASTFQQFLQTDAAINRGNSGGPLVNMRGEVIGVNSQIATSTGDYNGIGFALPSNEASFVYRQITDGGRVRRGYLGIFLESVRAEFARVYGLTDTRGAVVTDISDEQGPAARAGIQPGDIITEFNGEALATSQDLINRVASTPVGQTIQLAYLRDVNSRLERRTASVVIGERPPSPTSRTRTTAPTGGGAGAEEGASTGRPRLGLTLSELTPQLANENNLRGVRGLFVREVDPNGLAWDANLRGSMVIQRVNRTPVTSLAEFERIIGGLRPGDPVVMHVATYSERDRRVLQTIIQFTYQ